MFVCVCAHTHIYPNTLSHTHYATYTITHTAPLFILTFLYQVSQHSLTYTLCYTCMATHTHTFPQMHSLSCVTPLSSPFSPQGSFSLSLCRSHTHTLTQTHAISYVPFHHSPSCIHSHAPTSHIHTCTTPLFCLAHTCTSPSHTFSHNTPQH